MHDENEIIREVLEILSGNEEIEVRYDYSGRGMYGRQCPAIVVSNQFSAIMAILEAIEIVVERISDGHNDGYSIPGVFRWFEFSVDSMGRDIVMYFPGIDLGQDK